MNHLKCSLQLPHGRHMHDIEFKDVLFTGAYRMCARSGVGVGLMWSTDSSQLREQVNNVHTVVNLVLGGPGNIHGFVLDCKSYRQRYAASQTPTMPSVRITTSVYARLSEVARRSF